MKFVIVLFGFIVVCYGVKEEVFVCDPNVEYQENDCNYCSCEKSHLRCARMACPSQDEPRNKDCEVGTTWERDCNQCWCSEEWSTVCTIKKC